MLASSRHKASYLLLAFPFILFILFYTHRESLVSVQELLHTKANLDDPPRAHYDPASIHESKLEAPPPVHSSPPVVDPEPIPFDHSTPPRPTSTSPVAYGDADLAPDAHSPPIDFTNPQPTLDTPTLDTPTDPPPADIDSNSPPCLALAPHAQDTVVILKTGSTEIASKLPIHTTTTLRCYPHYLIFSDHAETFHNETILDALSSVSPTIQQTHPDFHLYRRLQSHGRASLSPTELAGPESELDPLGVGHNDNPGWKLDKWKFLPMVAETYARHPSKKWYIFVETDTYLFFHSALIHLAALDPTSPYYIGADTVIGDRHFNHGGSGFAVSQVAMRAVVDLYRSAQNYWETVTDNHWAGDAVLGEAFAKVGVSGTYGAPTWQGGAIGAVEWGDRGKWCAASVSFHHLSAREVGEMWWFEQGWIREGGEGMRWRDVFDGYVLPRVTQEKVDWENSSPSSRERMSGELDGTEKIEDLAACGRVCEGDAECVQYTFTGEGRCLTSSAPGLGGVKMGSRAGWVRGRMEAFATSMPGCEGEIVWPGTERSREALVG